MAVSMFSMTTKKRRRYAVLSERNRGAITDWVAKEWWLRMACGRWEGKSWKKARKGKVCDAVE